MTKTFTVYGKPMAKGRPRFSKFGTYTPKETVDYEKLIRCEYTSQCEGYYFGEQALKITVEAFFEIPKSTPKYKREKMLNGEIKHTQRPDYDNLSKIVTDALNGVSMHDDAQIFKAEISKEYSERPMLVVTITDEV